MYLIKDRLKYFFLTASPSRSYTYLQSTPLPSREKNPSYHIYATFDGSFLCFHGQFFFKMLYVIPSVLLAFLPDYCHSFQIIVIPSALVSFLPNVVIPSESLRELQILTRSKSFPCPKGKKNGHRRWPYMRVSYKLLKDSNK